MEQIFSPSIFIQLATSVVAICVSTFLITVVKIDKGQLYQLTSYCLGHVLQLFMICAAGNELTYQSKSMATNVYNNDWYLKTETDIRKSLIMMLRRCQRGSKMTALGIFDLSYETFGKVMQLSFSMYTLLSNIEERKM
ncbi:PREDICTED: odorant receptor 4-like [Nicrophorus vespilloides]|uniref:Odorant receptor 4-like n=1 Tax=Nicrophorus vespilloides TaxID=110193 RepID=A0ABM1MRR3_NICVS|nr:PREDICTED: odorant receptor 4-like [Nicrophorus vespilloides]